MTDKLHCPFCGAELVDEGAKIGNEGRFFACENLDCDLCGETFGLQIWQALIDGKKAQDALKVATDALSKIDAFSCHRKGALEIIAGMASIANRALYEITSITKQEE